MPMRSDKVITCGWCLYVFVRLRLPVRASICLSVCAFVFVWVQCVSSRQRTTLLRCIPGG